MALLLAHGHIEHLDQRSSDANARTVYSLVAQQVGEGGGELVERDPELESTQTADERVADPATEAPTASDQPVNNAA